MADIRAALKVVQSCTLSWYWPHTPSCHLQLYVAVLLRESTTIFPHCRPPVPRQVELPSCLDNPQAPSNTPMARLKRTAERAGALLAFQVKPLAWFVSRDPAVFRHHIDSHAHLLLAVRWMPHRALYMPMHFSRTHMVLMSQ